MEEDNDDQWLYGEDPAGEKPEVADKTDDSSELPLSSANPPEPEGNIPEALPYKVSFLHDTARSGVFKTVKSLVNLIFRIIRSLSYYV